MSLTVVDSKMQNCVRL